MDEKIDYDIEAQSGITTVYSVPISKHIIDPNIEIITLKKGTSDTGVTFFNIYRGRKMVKQFYGENSEKKAYEFIEQLQEFHSKDS